MFWVGVAVALLAGLVELFRTPLGETFSWATGGRVDWMAFGLLVVGLSVSIIDHLGTEAALEKLKPRELTTKQRVSVLSELARYVEREKTETSVVVATQMLDPESQGLGGELSSVFKNAGWRTTFTPMSTHVFSGIAVFANPEFAVQDELGAIKNALSSAGIQFSTGHLDVNRIPIQQEGSIYIVVGHK